MPSTIEPSQIIAIGGSVFQFVSLTFLSRDAFRDSEPIDHQKRDCLEKLSADHCEAVFGFMEIELTNEGFLAEDASVDERAKVDQARMKEAGRIASLIWEDAIVARKLESYWSQWRRWEGLGRFACDAGRILAGMTAIVLLIMYLRGEFPDLGRGAALVIFLLVVGGPLLATLICLGPKALVQSKAMRILDAPERGTIRGIRRFGGA